jgi:hypothetical protein
MVRPRSWVWLLWIGAALALVLAASIGRFVLRQPLDVATSKGAVTIDVRNLGEYSSNVRRIRLSEAGTSRAIWELEAQGGETFPLGTIELRAGLNPSVPDGVKGARVVTPGTATFQLQPGGYRVDLWTYKEWHVPRQVSATFELPPVGETHRSQGSASDVSVSSPPWAFQEVPLEEADAVLVVDVSIPDLVGDRTQRFPLKRNPGEGGMHVDGPTRGEAADDPLSGEGYVGGIRLDAESSAAVRVRVWFSGRHAGSDVEVDRTLVVPWLGSSTMALPDGGEVRGRFEAR